MSLQAKHAPAVMLRAVAGRSTDAVAPELHGTMRTHRRGARPTLTHPWRMGKLTTHVLDTAHGCPAAGMALTLWRLDGASPRLLASLVLNADGRADAPLLEGADLLPGRYRLLFDVAQYFRRRGLALSDPPFLDQVPLDFGVADAAAHYHVPLLVSPYSFSTYRGS
jgi:5-hydroxyisourate hydrolase